MAMQSNLDSRFWGKRFWLDLVAIWPMETLEGGGLIISSPWPFRSNFILKGGGNPDTRMKEVINGRLVNMVPFIPPGSSYDWGVPSVGWLDCLLVDSISLVVFASFFPPVEVLPVSPFLSCSSNGLMRS